MALVAYSDDSDLGSDSEEVEENFKCAESSITTKSPTKKIESETALEARPESYQKPKVSSNSSIEIHKRKKEVTSTTGDIVEDDEEAFQFKKPSLFASVPAALPVGPDQTIRVGEKEDELTDVPTVDTWKVTADIKKDTGYGKERSNIPSAREPSKKKKSKVKFFVPALSEFDDDDDEEEPMKEPERKKVKPSAKGTGLFSVLPEPKHISVKETKRALIPHILTKPPPTKKPIKPKPVIEKKQVELHDSDEEDAGTCDFFSLSESPDDITAVDPIPVSATQVSVPTVQVSKDPISKPDIYTQDVRTNFEEQIPVESGSHLKLQEDSQYLHQPQVQDDVRAPSEMDQEAMIRLMGKRRGKGEAINFIDINADDALLTRDEWMTKSLSEEKPAHSYSKKREGLPSQKQKQKHQITYLAHQAKEREIELKNNWAQSRATKMQTQAKYGF